MKVQEEIKPTSDGAKLETLTPRQLDVRVAEHVFGHKAVWSAAIYGDWMDRSSGRSDVRLPRYSTNREAALEVVDHFAEADWRIMLTSNPHAPETLRWRVELFKELWPNSNNISVMELAETLPEAICLAALSAKAAESFTQTVVE